MNQRGMFLCVNNFVPFVLIKLFVSIMFWYFLIYSTENISETKNRTVLALGWMMLLWFYALCPLIYESKRLHKRQTFNIFRRAGKRLEWIVILANSFCGKMYYCEANRREREREKWWRSVNKKSLLNASKSTHWKYID